MDPTLLQAGPVDWAYSLNEGFSKLEVTDIDLIVFDSREKVTDSSVDLKALLAHIPVTTRVLAIVEQLPSEEICAESGVVYLTPPVNLGDINWFIRSYQAAASA